MPSPTHSRAPLYTLGPQPRHARGRSLCWIVGLAGVLMATSATHALAKPARVVVLPSTVDELPLFPEEVEQVRQAVEAFVTKRKFKIDKRATKQVLASLAAGRLHHTGPVCAVPATAEAVFNALPNADDLTAVHLQMEYGCTVMADFLGTSASCSWGDSLVVRMSAVGKDGKRKTTGRWRAVPAAPHDVKHWLTAVDKLRDYKPSMMGMLMAGPRGVKTPGVETLDRHVFGGLEAPRRWDGSGAMGLGGDALADAFRSEPLTEAEKRARAARKAKAEAAAARRAERDAEETKAFAACHAPGLDTQVYVVLALSEAGAVTRCHTWATYTRDPMKAEQQMASCLCERAPIRSYEVGRPGRRVLLRVGNKASRPPHAVEEAKGEVFGPTASNSKLSRRDLGGHAPVTAVTRRLQECTPDGARPADVELVWRVSPAGHGEITAVRVSGEGAEDVRPCVERLVGTLETVCTPDGKSAELMTSFTLKRGRLWGW